MSYYLNLFLDGLYVLRSVSLRWAGILTLVAIALTSLFLRRSKAKQNDIDMRAKVRRVRRRLAVLAVVFFLSSAALVVMDEHAPTDLVFEPSEKMLREMRKKIDENAELLSKNRSDLFNDVLGITVCEDEAQAKEMAKNINEDVPLESEFQSESLFLYTSRAKYNKTTILIIIEPPYYSAEACIAYGKYCIQLTPSSYRLSRLDNELLVSLDSIIEQCKYSDDYCYVL